jgi:3-isopropylmalate/(R)-2-methylmalate dehydratase small subunit
MPAFARDCLLEGLDQIGWTLTHESEIAEFEQNHHSRQPWLLAG